MIKDNPRKHAEMKFTSRKAKEILSFWFGEDISYDEEIVLKERVEHFWFTENETLDRQIRKRFKQDLEAVTDNIVNEIRDTSEKLAMMILLDQFSRNMFRESAQAFARDHLALRLAKEMVNRNEDTKLKPVERVFVYLPLEHSEDQEDQKLSVKKFKELHRQVAQEMRKVYQVFLDYAIKHKVIIDRFGRFPHRNEILGRKSTTEELEFLKQRDSHF